jgi:hypothetical protein
MDKSYDGGPFPMKGHISFRLTFQALSICTVSTKDSERLLRITFSTFYCVADDKVAVSSTIGKQKT